MTIEKEDKGNVIDQSGVGLWPTLKYQPLYKLTRTAILGKIEEGYFKEGDILPSTREMARIFGVSIITIRNAIKTLQDEGIVELRHGYGVVVKKSTNMGYKRGLDNIIALLDKDKRAGLIGKQELKQVSKKLNLREEVKELFDIRAILEGEAVRSACRRINPDAIKAVKDKIMKVLSQKEIDPYLGFQIDVEMHKIIIQNCSNNRLAHMIRRINEEIEIYRLIYAKEISERDTRDLLKDNLLILDALLERKSNECKKLIKRHIGEAKVYCLARWREEVQTKKKGQKNGR